MTKLNALGYISCPACQIGHLGAKKVLFFHQGVTGPIVAPQFSGWVCDLCGVQFYDPEALFRLRAMLWTSRSKHRFSQAKTKKKDQASLHENREQRRRP